MLYNPIAVDFDNQALGMLKERIRLESDATLFSDTIQYLIQDIQNGTSMVLQKQFVNNYMLMEHSHKRLDSFFRNHFSLNEYPENCDQEIL